MSNYVLPSNTSRELSNLKKKIAQDRFDKQDHSKMIATEMFMAIVKSVDSKNLTVDVFITKLNAEVKNVSVLMPTMSVDSGKLSLPQINSAVIIAFVSYMKPFIVATLPFLDAKIPEIYKQESLEYTNNTYTKHTFNGDILNIAGSRNASVLKSDGSNQSYSSDNAEYSKDGISIRTINDLLGSMEYDRVNIGTKDVETYSARTKLSELKSKLSEHVDSLTEFKNIIISNGIDSESILNSVSQLRSLLYNEYKGSDYYIETQKGYALDKDIQSITDIKNATEDDILFSVHGKKIIYQTVCKTSNGGLTISIDEDRNIDVDCNKFTINGREVFRYD